MRMRDRTVYRRYRLELLLLTPLFLYLLCFTLGPILYTILISFKEQLSGAFPSVLNYTSLVKNFQFAKALSNTLLITCISLFGELLLGFFLALLMAKRFVGKGLLRAIILLPLGIPTIVAAANMRYIFDTQGYLNEVLIRSGILRLPIDWMGGGLRTILTIAVSDVWKVTPLVMLILLAGLESIPETLYEAAKVDGASEWEIVKKITLPLLKPFITIAFVVRGIDAFRLFELPLTLTGTRTPVLSTFTYFEYFEYNDPYASAASACILFCVILTCVILYFRVTGKEEETLYQ